VAEVNPAYSPVLDPIEILELWDDRRRAYGERDSLYEIFNRYYRGKSQSAGSPSVQGANSQGRPLLRVGESVNRERVFSSQRLAPIIDDKQALLGRMPATRVEPKDQSPEGVNNGELLTKFLISTHELSSMDRQQAEMGFYLPCLGDGCYLLEVEPDLRRVVWTVVDPSTAYPSFMSGYRRYDILDLIIHYDLDPYAARARWGRKFEAEEQKMVPVTIYISKHQRSVVVGKAQPELVQHMDWNLKFCPAVWVFNKLNGQMANSDIAQALVQQDALDFVWAVKLDGLVQNTYPIIGVRNPLSVSGEPIQVGPGAPPVPLGVDGEITVANSTGNLAAANTMSQDLVGEINVATGTSQVRQEGTMHSSIQTGRAAHALQGPQATRVELNQAELGAAIQKANAMTLEMQEKAPLLGDHEFEIYGRYKGAAFLQKMSGKDIDGWYRTSVFWEPVTGMNLQQKTAVAYEGKMAKLWSGHRAMEIAGVDDPTGMQRQIEQETIAEAHIQAEAQGIMGGGQAPPGGGGPPGGAPPGGPSPQGGPPSPGGGPAPMNIARPAGLGADKAPGQGLPTGVPQGVSRDAVQKALGIVAPNLKATVAIIGEIAQKGEGKHIEVLVSDFRDVPRVTPILRALDPTAKVNVKKESEWPSDAIRVA
jgi:hypothetical protein